MSGEGEKEGKDGVGERKGGRETLFCFCIYDLKLDNTRLFHLKT